MKTNDIAFRLDDDEACIWSLMNGRGAEGWHWGETTTGLQALSLCPSGYQSHTSSHRDPDLAIPSTTICCLGHAALGLTCAASSVDGSM